MAFYGERFRRPDEEDIWEELRQMLLNPPSQEEIALKKQQEQAQINAILDRVFPDIEKPAKEPYLTREELFGLDGQTTGMATPLLEGKISYDLPRDPFKEIDENPNLSDEEKAQRKEQVVQSMKKYKDENNKINREHAWEQTKNYGGAALEIGSAFVPGYGGTKLAGTLAGKVAPKVGRKIAQELATGTLKGASSGTMEGFGRGLMEDKNPLVTAAQDTLTGAALGGASGAVGGNVEKAIRGNKLRKVDSIEGYNKAEIKNLRKYATNYYDDYIKGTTVKRKDMDDISFGNAGIGELRSKSLHNINILPDLKKQIKTGTRKPSKYDYNREDVSGFDIIENTKNGKTYEYQIANDKANGNKFYMVKETTKTDSFPTYWDQHPGSGKSPNDIISPLKSNLNPLDSNQTLQPPKSHNQWLEDLKRKCKNRWF